MRRALLAFIGAAFAVGLLVRLGAARGDLWLDEIWSLQLASAARSPLDVLWTLHHDNNNHLNTLWLMALGGDAPPILYRMPAVASGLGVMILAASASRRRSSFEVAAVALLVAVSPFMVQYGSEARGYGLAMLFSLSSFLCLGRYLETRRRRFALAFALTGSLGVLSHLTVSFVMAAAYAWAGFELVRRRQTRIADLALLALPAAVLAFLWLVDVRFYEVGGAPDSDLSLVLRELARVTFGLPRGLFELLAIPCLGLVAVELFALARERDVRLIFFLALYLVPAVSLLVWLPNYPAPRHFAVLVPFTLLLAAGALGRLAHLGRYRRATAALALALIAAGSAVELVPLLRDGRGHYRDAVQLMLANGTSQPVTVGGFNDFRNRMVLDYQAHRLGAEDRMVYVERASLAARPPEWLLLLSFDERPSLMEAVEVERRRYQLVAVSRYAGLSGWTWIVYRAQPAPPLRPGTEGSLWIRGQP